MKKYKLIYHPAALLILLLLGSAKVAAQKVFNAVPAYTTAAELVALQQVFKRQTLVQLDAAAIYVFAKQKGTKCNFVIDVSNRYRWDIDLEQHELRGADYMLQRTTDSGVITMPRTACITWAGNLKGNNADYVRLNLQDKKLSGCIIYHGKAVYIEPLTNFLSAASANKYVIYERGDTRPVKAFCGVTATAEQKVNEKLSTLNVPLAADCRKIEVATESDWENYAQGITDADIAGNLNLVEPLYLNYFGATIVIKYQHEWATPADPYTGDSICNDFGVNRLTEFRNYWTGNYTWVKRDISIAYMAAPTGGNAVGCAITGAFSAAGDLRYAVAKWNTAASDEFRQVIVTHEMGHSFGADHDVTSLCDGDDGPIMCPNLSNICFGSCTPYWSAASITSITSGMTSTEGSKRLREREFFTDINTSIRFGNPESFSGNELFLEQQNVVGFGILGNGSILFTGTDKVSLKEGFSASISSGTGSFSAKIGLCNVLGELRSDSTKQAVAAVKQDIIKHTTSIKVYPNPFTSSTNVAITLEAAAQVSVYVYNMPGKLVDDPVKNKTMPAGVNNISYANSRLPGGIYLIVVEINGRRFTQKLVKL